MNKMQNISYKQKANILLRENIYTTVNSQQEHETPEDKIHIVTQNYHSTVISKSSTAMANYLNVNHESYKLLLLMITLWSYSTVPTKVHVLCMTMNHRGVQYTLILKLCKPKYLHKLQYCWVGKKI